jgi:hypothetical protein
MAFIVETGCWGCEGGPRSLVRIYRDPAGNIRSETILDPSALGYPKQRAVSPDGSTYDYDPAINGLAVLPDASLMAASVCIEGGCDAGGLGTWQAGSVAAVLRSTDGGVTWDEIGRGGPALSVVGLLEGGEVLTINYLQPLSGIEFRTYPGNEPVERPAGATDYPPVTTLLGELFWRSADGALLRHDGSTFIPARNGINPGWRMLGHATPGKGSFLLGVEMSEQEASSYGIEAYEMRGDLPIRQRVYKTEQILVPGSLVQAPGSSKEDDLAIISITVPPPPDIVAPVPAIFDLNSGEYRLIKDPFVKSEPPYQPYGRSIVDAVQVGPFARVVNTGSCLNVRKEPSLSAQTVGCMPDGVLLRDTGEELDVAGGRWLRVVTPGLETGWVTTEFIER